MFETAGKPQTKPRQCKVPLCNASVAMVVMYKFTPTAATTVKFSTTNKQTMGRNTISNNNMFSISPSVLQFQHLQVDIFDRMPLACQRDNSSAHNPYFLLVLPVGQCCHLPCEIYSTSTQ